MNHVLRLVLVSLLFLSATQKTLAEAPQSPLPGVTTPDATASNQEAEETLAVSRNEGTSSESDSLEPMVVTATRVETPASQATKSVDILTSKDRDEQQQYFLPELLNNEPGVYLRRLGGPGQWSNITIRGAGSQHIQYQYNGFPLRDAADTQSTIQYFIEDLYSGSNLKQVEVLKGTQSTLYGSQAMGGVINIIPDKWKRGMGAEIRTEFGENNTFLENGRFYHGQDQFYLDFNPIYMTTDGQDNGGRFGYYYENLGFTAGAGYRLAPDITLEFSSIYSTTDLAMSQDTPSFNAAGDLVKNTADPDRHRESLMAQYGLTMKHIVSPCWNYSVKGAYTETQRHYFWSSADGNQSNYDGSTAYLETQHNFQVTDWLGLIVGMDYEHSYYDGREPADQYGGDYSPVKCREDWYSYDLFSLASFKFLDESFFINLGGRFNDHQEFDPKVVGEASAAYLFKPYGTKIHGQIGTGYRTPSLYEIYGGYVYRGHLITIGNPDLEPEESLGYELGIEQTVFGEVLKVGLNWFYTDFDNLITYDSINNRYMNASKGKAQGIETYVNVAPWKWVKLDFAYTYTHSEYQAKGSDEWIRKEYLPQNKISGQLTVTSPWDITGSLRAVWQDEKVVPLYDANWNNVRWEEPSVVTFDAALTYTFRKKVQAYVRVENLFDEDYTESGYVMPGRTFYGGIKFTF